MMLVRTTLAQSTIHGIGIFADAPIARGTRIWELMEGLDPVFDAALLDTAPEPIRSYLRRYTYPHYADASKIILDGDNGRFMNHSPTPNTDFKNIHGKYGFAIVDIAAGTEITCDYAEFAPGFALE